MVGAGRVVGIGAKVSLALSEVSSVDDVAATEVLGPAAGMTVELDSVARLSMGSSVGPVATAATNSPKTMTSAATAPSTLRRPGGGALLAKMPSFLGITRIRPRGVVEMAILGSTRTPAVVSRRGPATVLSDEASWPALQRSDGSSTSAAPRIGRRPYGADE